MNRLSENLLSVIDTPQEVSADQPALLVALDRLLNIGALYPQSHSKCREVQDEFRARVQNVIADAPTLRIEAQRHELFIQGERVAEKQNGASRIHDMLWTLGISRLEILRSATSSDLYTLVMTLQQQRHIIDASLHFHQIDFQDLPETIKVIQREFGQRSGPASSGGGQNDSIHNAVRLACKELQDKNLDPQTRASYEKIVHKLFSRVAERLDTTSTHDPSRIGRSLNDVLELGAHAVRKAIETLAEEDGNLTRMPELFKNAEEALAYSQDHESVDLIFQMLKQSSRPQDASETASTEQLNNDTSDYDLSITDLKGLLAQVAPTPCTGKDLPIKDNGELLGIYFNVLLTEPSPRLFRELINKLCDSLAKPLSAGQRDVLVKSCRELLQPDKQQLIDRILPVLTAALHKADPAAVTAFWILVCEDLETEAKLVAWPHLVEEIICDPRHDATSQELLYPLLAGLSFKQMSTEIGRLEILSTCQSGRFNKRLLLDPPAELYPLMAVLLNTTRTQVPGRLICQGLHNRARKESAAALLSGFPKYHPQWRQHFQAGLLIGLGGKPNTVLRERTTKALVALLTTLPEKKRTESWVPRTVEVLARHGTASGHKLLQNIIEQKKYRIIPAWPSRVRKQARLITGGGRRAE